MAPSMNEILAVILGRWSGKKTVSAHHDAFETGCANCGEVSLD